MQANKRQPTFHHKFDPGRFAKCQVVVWLDHICGQPVDASIHRFYRCGQPSCGVETMSIESRDRHEAEIHGEGW